MAIKKVAVIGAGLMGTGITQVIAGAGFPVIWQDVSVQQLDNGMDRIEKVLSRQVSKQKIHNNHKVKTLNNISITQELKAVSDVDLLIEAIPEDINLKQSIFSQVNKLVQPNCILVTNTSGLSITAIAAVTTCPQKVIGAHFFYPAPLMGLVEIIPGLATSKETVEEIGQFIKDIGKTPVHCYDYPGFIVNRLLIPLVNEAIFMVMEGNAPETIDAAMRLGANHPMGPITLADYVGLDTLLATMEGLYTGFKDPKYRPCPLLIKKVEAGHLGRKTGQGFYQYDTNGN